VKIAVDFQSVEGRKTGIGVAAQNLLEAISKEDPSIEFLYYKKNSLKDLNTPSRIFWESVSIPMRAFRDKPDFIYSPGFAPAFFAPCPRVVTVHDLIGMIYPENLPPAARFYWSTWLPFCVRHAKIVTASSESTKKDIVRFLKIDPLRIRVVPLAAADSFHKEDDESKLEPLRRRFSLQKPFFLTVGTLEPRKNIPNLLRAFEIFKRNTDGRADLLLAGKAGGEQDKIKAVIRELKLERDVRLLGYVADEELCSLYSASLGYVFVSSYEGFGLPALEAMRCGKSGVLSRVSSLPEVASDTALYADPASVKDIAEKLLLFYEDRVLRDRLSEAAYRRSAEFSWKKSAQMMIEIFKSSVYNRLDEK